jgi:hypothetical protein
MLFGCSLCLPLRTITQEVVFFPELAYRDKELTSWLNRRDRAAADEAEAKVCVERTGSSVLVKYSFRPNAAAEWKSTDKFVLYQGSDRFMELFRRRVESANIRLLFHSRLEVILMVRLLLTTWARFVAFVA